MGVEPTKIIVVTIAYAYINTYQQTREDSNTFHLMKDWVMRAIDFISSIHVACYQKRF